MIIRDASRYLAWPILLFGFGGAIVWAGAVGAGMPAMFVILAVAVAFTFLVERLIPYQPAWNSSLGDARRDWLHAVVNLTISRSALWLLPLLAWLTVAGGLWPRHWPYTLQVLLAVLVLDAGIAAAHHASHRITWLWRFHAVHHSPRRLYGFNGLMKHPVHQMVEMGSGVLPLLLLGIPVEIAVTLPFLVAIALLCQHTNADIRTGWLRFVFANAEVHRFHHRNDEAGDVNFGLFTTFYDHLMGTFYWRPGMAPQESGDLGIAGRSDYPTGYLDQLREPFRSEVAL